MALRVQVLRKKAEKFETKMLLVHKVTKEGSGALEPLLQDILSNQRPKPKDYEARKNLIRVFNDISKEIYGNSNNAPVVVEFGSFVMDLFSATSDLDLSVNFNLDSANFPRDKKIQTLRKFARKLYALQSKGHVNGVFPIITAKVPIVKVVDCGTGVECDISVENRDGILKSKIIHIISSIDERFHKLSFLMKIWAKAQNINSSKDKTLNSLSIILLVAFHLQTRNPPILPPFSAIFKDGTDPETVVKSVATFVDFGRSNAESLAELFLTLLIKLYSVETLWPKGICASTCEGSWISRTWNSKVASISVEDFTDRSQNVARAVGPAQAKKINKCVEISIGHVYSFLDGKFGDLEMKELLFGQDRISLPLLKDSLSLHPVAALHADSSQSKPSNPVPKRQKRKQSIATPVRKKKTKLATQHGAPFVSVNQQQAMANWGGMQARTQLPMAGGWRGVQQAAQGSWEAFPRPPTVSWIGPRRPAADVCIGAHPPTDRGWGPSPIELGGAHPPADRGWGPLPIELEGAHPPMAGGWGSLPIELGRAHPPTDRGWGPLPIELEGAHPPMAGGWGPPATGWGVHRHSARAWEGAQLPTARVWVGARQPNSQSWGRVPRHVAASYHRRTDPNTRNF